MEIKIVVFKWDEYPGQLIPSGNTHKTKIRYNANYVNKHYEMVSQYLDKFEYICVTDNPKDLSKNIQTVDLWNKCRHLGGCYNRLYLFSSEIKDILGDEFFHVDLDTTVIKNFSHLFNVKKDLTFFRFLPISSKYYNYQPGICYIKTNHGLDIWDRFINNFETNIHKSRQLFNGTDQAWINYLIHLKNLKVDYWDSTHGIYNINRLSKLPNNASLISWAGPRDPNTHAHQYPWIRKYIK